LIVENAIDVIGADGTGDTVEVLSNYAFVRDVLTVDNDWFEANTRRFVNYEGAWMKVRFKLVNNPQTVSNYYGRFFESGYKMWSVSPYQYFMGFVFEHLTPPEVLTPKIRVKSIIYRTDNPPTIESTIYINTISTIDWDSTHLYEVRYTPPDTWEFFFDHNPSSINFSVPDTFFEAGLHAYTGSLLATNTLELTCYGWTIVLPWEQIT